VGVEKAFAPAPGMDAVTLIRRDVGDEPVLEADFASLQAIKGAIRIEQSARNGRAMHFDGFENVLQLRFKLDFVHLTENGGQI
jgi:hypothetical protein